MAYLCLRNPGYECDGCGDCGNVRFYCSVCGSPNSEVYISLYGEVVGCECCVITRSPAEYANGRRESRQTKRRGK